MATGITLEEVNELREFGNRLLRCKTLEEVVSVTFSKIEEKLHPQVISLFLFSKDGTLKRERMKGFDVYGMEIEDNWFPDEEYKPGESFSGRAASPKNPASSSPYGETYWVNDLESELEKFLNGKDYKAKLGSLKCGISVPLNGTHRTFGTLEALNKGYGSDDTSTSFVYLDSEVCWLTVLGAHVSSAVSRIRRKEEEKICTNISRKLADPDNRKVPQAEVYKSITDQFIGKLTPYKACILREGHGDKLFVIERSCTSDITFDGKGLEPRSVKGCLVGDVYQKKEPLIVDHIRSSDNRFFSLDWITSQGLKSFVCFPLTIQGESVGTISLYSGYTHKFTGNDIEFLENISYLLAAYIVGIKRASDAKLPKFEWNGVVVAGLSPIENKVLVALKSPEWEFRTVKGVASETGLTEESVKSTLEKYRGIYARVSLVPDNNGNALYTLISRFVTTREGRI